MIHTRFCYEVPPAPATWHLDRDLTRLNWERIPSLPPFRRHDDSRLATYQTEARLCADADALYVRFDCHDPHIWGTLDQRDQPIYEEEVVEIFLAPGEADPSRYFEFEVSPNAVLFDAEIITPASPAEAITVNRDWDCPGIRWQAERDDSRDWWAAFLAIPWRSLSSAAQLPDVWRANLYRIERPAAAAAEFSCWSPTMAEPANFHRPPFFGTFIRPV